MKNIRVFPLLIGCLAFGQSVADTVDLTGKGWVQYGDAKSYSLPLSGLEVMSGPGQIDLFTKVGLGANGQLDNNTANMDNAYDTPNPNNAQSNGFRMADENDPGGLQAGGWDRNGWWDASLAALSGALGGNLPVFFFANNETGTDGKLLEGSSASLAVWGRIEITRISTGALLGRYDLANRSDNSGDPVGYGPPPIGGGKLMGDPLNFTSTGAAPVVSDFLMAGGKVCIGVAGSPVACDGSQGTVVDTVQHNLGGDRAAYAIVVPELNELLTNLMLGNLNDYAFHMDVRLGCGDEGAFPVEQQGGRTLCQGAYSLNGGDEKIFIGTMDLIQRVPEPGSLALLAIAFLGLGFVSKRKII